MNKNDRICIVGHKGMLGHAIWDKLIDSGYTNLIGCDLPEVDLCNQAMTFNFFEREKPKYVFFLAAVAAGISYKKNYPADMLLKNIQIISNVFDACFKTNVTKMINVCSALVYSSNCPMPYSEKDINVAELNKIDTPYALAKIVGIQLASFFNQQYGHNIVTLIPCNFFGPHAPFEGEKAGVIPALIDRFYKAKINKDPCVTVWGSGNACREFLCSYDVADACIFFMNTFTEKRIINVGRGKEYTIKEVSFLIKKIVGYSGDICFDKTKPDGRSHMLLDVSISKEYKWYPKMNLEESIMMAYEWYKSAVTLEK